VKPLMLVRGGLGDAIMAIPAIEALRALPLVGERMGKPVNILAHGLRVPGVLDLFARQAWCGRVYRRVADVPRTATGLIGHWRGNPELPGVRLHVPTSEEGHISDRLVDVVRGLGYIGPTPPARLLFGKVQPFRHFRRVCLAPETTGYAWKRWPEGHWVELCRGIRKRGYEIVLLGSEWRSVRYRSLCADYRGKTTIEQAATLMLKSSAVVGIDSGLLHLAAALGCRTVGLYGPTDPGLCGPRSGTVVQPDTACAPCWRDPTAQCLCALMPRKEQAEPKSPSMPTVPCMQAITVEQVLEALP